MVVAGTVGLLALYGWHRARAAREAKPPAGRLQVAVGLSCAVLGGVLAAVAGTRGWPMWLALPATGLIMVALAYGIERLVLRHLVNQEGIILFMATLGIAYFIDGAGQTIWGSDIYKVDLGLPKNPQNPFYTQPPEINPDGAAWIDYGLGGFLRSAGFEPEIYEPELGKHKVPTLRNVDQRPAPGFVKAFGHNGVFKSLEEIVHFYNTRDVALLPPAEVQQNVNTRELGDLKLKPDEEDAIVAFLKTLTDGYEPE